MLMAGIGPPPKDPSQRRRRNATVPMTQLPADGYDGPVPEWPLPSLDDGEAELWAELWRTPQAAQWAALKWTREVAMYVRWLARAQLGDLDAGKEARMLSDRLGLNPQAMLRLRWQVAEGEVTSIGKARSAPASRRFTVVDETA